MNSDAASHRAGLVIGCCLVSHFACDFLSGIVPGLLPMLKQHYALSLAQAGAMAAAMTFTGHLLQPVLGYFADRSGRRSVGALGLVWISAFMMVVPLARGPVALAAVCALAALGSALLHPVASAGVVTLAAGRGDTVLSFFYVLGWLGLALAPATVVPYVVRYGMRVVLLPSGLGLGVGLALYLAMARAESGESPAVPGPTREPRDMTAVAPAARAYVGSIARLVLIVILRDWIHISVRTYVPLFAVEKGLGAVGAARLLTMMRLADVVGLVIGAATARRAGKRFVVWASLVVTGMLTYCFALMGAGWGAAATTVVLASCALSNSSFALTVALANEVAPAGAAGTVCGVVMGLSEGVVSLAVPAAGALADATGPVVFLKVMGVLAVSLGLAAALGLMPAGTGAAPEAIPRGDSGSAAVGVVK